MIENQQSDLIPMLIMVNHFLQDRFVIPDGPVYVTQILKCANKSWKQYKYSLKKDYYKPEEKTETQMTTEAVPQHGISSKEWIKLVRFWYSDEGQVSTMFLIEV